MAQKKIKNNLNFNIKLLNQKNTFIFLVSTSSFFISLAFFILNLEKFNIYFAFFSIILITFAFHSFSIILVSLLTKYEIDETSNCQKQNHVANLIYLSRILKNQITLQKAEQLEKKIEIKSKELNIRTDINTVDDIHIQSFKLKLAEGLYDYSLKKEFLE